jgi:hypothetical protein
MNGMVEGHSPKDGVFDLEEEGIYIYKIYKIYKTHSVIVIGPVGDYPRWSLTWGNRPPGHPNT